MGDGFYRSKDPTNSIKVLKEKAVKENNTTQKLFAQTSRIARFLCEQCEFVIHG